MNNDEEFRSEMAPPGEGQAEVFERPDYAAQLSHILRDQSLTRSEKKSLLADYHANDLADVLQELTPEERRRLYALLDQDSVSEIFSYLEDSSEYLKELGVEAAADVLENMDADDAA